MVTPLTGVIVVVPLTGLMVTGPILIDGVMPDLDRFKLKLGDTLIR